MTTVNLTYFTESGEQVSERTKYETSQVTRNSLSQEICEMMRNGRMPGRFPESSFAVLATAMFNPPVTFMVVPDSWTNWDVPTEPYAPTTDEVLDKATAITQQANTLCETLVCTALSLHGVMGFKGDIGREHKRAASTTEFLKSAILSNLCLRQYTATGDELAIIQCLIPLFKDK